MSRILLAEDDAAMAQMIRDILETGGHAVAHALDGVDALRFLGIEPPEEIKRQSGASDWKLLKNCWTTDASQITLPDLVISDCMMPRLDGLTLVKQMAADENIRALPVIVLTSKAKMEEPFLQLGNVKGFLLKPADPDALLALVKTTLESGRPPAP